jgi:hypothetical protein
MPRSTYANVVTTANQVLGQRNTEQLFYRGNATNQGGFFFWARCGFAVWTNGGRFFAGMSPNNNVISGNPSSQNNTAGFCIDSGDAGAISFLTRDTATATKQATGFTAATDKLYDVFIYNPPNSGTFSYTIIDIVAGTEYSNSATLTPPTAGAVLTANVLASNAALTPVTSISLAVMRILIQTIYC